MLREALDTRLFPRQDVEQRMASEKGLANPIGTFWAVVMLDGCALLLRVAERKVVVQGG